MRPRPPISVERLTLHVPAMSAGEAEQLGRQVAAELAARAIGSETAPGGKIGTLRVTLAPPTLRDGRSLAGCIASAIGDAAAGGGPRR
jgi:hypothetical protein